MSTRSIIVITGKGSYGDKTIRLYKHSDGYPTGNLPVIRDALKQAIEATDAENKENEKYNIERRYGLHVEHAAALIIGVSASVYGFGAKVDAYEGDDAVYGEKLELSHLGNQGDLEWIYVVDLEAKTLKIYNGNQESVIKGKVVNPESYAVQLYEQYQSGTIQATRALVASIEALGFRVNPKPKRKPRAKKLELVNE